jgi:hypothetical protein
MKQIKRILLFLVSILMMGCTPGVIIEYPLQTPCGDNVQSLYMDDSQVEEIVFIGDEVFKIRTLASCITKSDSVLILSTNNISGINLKIADKCYQAPSGICSYDERVVSEEKEDGSVVYDGVHVSKSLLIYDYKNEAVLYIDSIFKEFYRIPE